MDKSMVKMLVVLGLISVLVAVGLANVYQKTSPLIEANRERVIKEAIKKVLPKAKTYKQKIVKGISVYTGIDSKGDELGYAFISIGPGYQGKINIMVGIDKTLTKLTGIYVMENVETPGLGSRITEDSFQKQFVNLSTKPQIEYVKNQKPQKDNQIQAITGATISSRSVVENINKTLSVLKRHLKNGN